MPLISGTSYVFCFASIHFAQEDDKVCLEPYLQTHKPLFIPDNAK